QRHSILDVTARSVPLTPPGLGSTTWSRRRLPKVLYPLFGRRQARAFARREDRMSRISPVSGNGQNDLPVIQLMLELREPLLVAYFEPFEDPERSAKALEALKVGVIALQTACPTLDTQIVKDQFAEMQEDFGVALAR